MMIARGCVTASLLALAVLPGLSYADDTPRIEAAIPLLDAQKCDDAVDAINAGMLAGEPKAFFVAGQIFQHGYCVIPNKPRASEYYARGARLGEREAARSLALMHAVGDGLPQSWPDAGRWYAVMREPQPVGLTAKIPVAATYASPDAVVKTYIDAVHDLAVERTPYPREAVDAKVTATVTMRFDPRIGRATLVSARDDRAPGATSSPSRDDFVRALIAGYAEAVRTLPRPSMSPHVDNSSERTVRFDRVVWRGDQPFGLQALAR